MRRGSMSQPPIMSDLNIVLLGLTGAGKSASGNTILGGDRKTFKEGYSPASETEICSASQTEVDGQTITVTDTVGLTHTGVNVTDVQTKIEQILQNTHHGIDVFLLVIKLDQTFTKEKCEAVKWAQKNFGAKVLNHAIVLLTHGDQLGEPVEDYLSKNEPLRSLVDQCSGGFHVFNNKDEDRSQVTELLKKTESLRMKNGYRRYTKRVYKDTQKDLWLKKCDIFVVAIALVIAAVVFGGAALEGVVGVLGGVGGLGGAGVGGAALEGRADLLREAEAALMMPSAARCTGSAPLIGAAGGSALLGVAAFVGLYFLVRFLYFFSRENDIGD